MICFGLQFIFAMNHFSILGIFGFGDFTVIFAGGNEKGLGGGDGGAVMRSGNDEW